MGNAQELLAIMKEIKARRIQEIKADFARQGKSIDEEELDKLVTIKYLDKIKLIKQKGELTDKLDTFTIIEQVGGEFEIRYYSEDKELFALQRDINDKVLPLEHAMWDLPEELDELTQKDLDQAKDEKELEQEQKQQEQTPKTTQLAKNQLDAMPGPTTDLNQVIDGRTLRNVMGGIDGERIKFIDSTTDTAKKYLQNSERTSRFVPIMVKADGTGEPIGTDVLEVSSLEGTTSMSENPTVTNDGNVQNEQNILTFNIKALGEYQGAISISYDETSGSPEHLEIEYVYRTPGNPNEKLSVEFESVNNDPRQDNGTHQFRLETSDGMYKGDVAEERADLDDGETIAVENIDANINNNDIPVELIEEYAKAMNIKETDEHGYPTKEYDLETAKRMLEELIQENPDMSIEDIVENAIEDDIKTIGPSEDPHN